MHVDLMDGLVLKLCLAVVSLYGGPVSGQGPVTKGCCLPDQFEVVLGFNGGMDADIAPGVFKDEVPMSYDLVNQRWGISWVRKFVRGEVDLQLYVADYKQKSIYKHIRGRCYTDKTEDGFQMTPSCLPDDAEFMETMTLGSGEESLMYDVWQWQLHRPNARSIGVRSAIFHHNCMPFYDISFWEEQGVEEVYYMGYVDIVEGVSEINDQVFSTALKEKQSCAKMSTLKEDFALNPNRNLAFQFIQRRLGLL